MTTGDGAAIIVAFAAAVVTAVAAFYAAWQAKTAHDAYQLTRSLYVEQNQPYVFADLRSDEHQPGLVMLLVKNQGPTVAQDVRLVFDPPLNHDGAMNRESLANLDIPALPPGATHLILMGFGARFLAANEGASQVTISGMGRHGPMEVLTYPLQLQSLTTIGHKTMTHLVQVVERMAAGVENLGAS